MLKLLTCLIAAIAVGVALLQTRQQHLEINYQINKLHNRIESQQAKLWNQQLQIAIHAGNTTLAKSLDTRSLNLVPATPKPSFASDRPTLTASAR
jgi:cell division protein FtsL